MNTLTANPTKVAVCGHCGGTGLCGAGDRISDHHHEWLECPECGRGIPGVAGAAFSEDDHRPVCSKCHGTGFMEDSFLTRG